MEGLVYIKTKGRPSKINMKLCKNACRFYANKLLGDYLSSKINLTLEFEKFSPNDKYIAFCTWEFDNHYSRDFIISVNQDLNKRSMLMALAHEMVHLKQYAKGELKDYVKANKCKWMGEQYNSDELDYWDHPWEIEAYGRERGLYVKFKEHMKGK